jgi:hypothetical protein
MWSPTALVLCVIVFLCLLSVGDSKVRETQWKEFDD